MVVINSNEVTDYDRELGQVYSFSFSEMAFKIGSLQAVNMIALGFIVGKTKIVRKEASNPIATVAGTTQARTAALGVFPS